MKHLKKIMVLLLALVMCMAMSATAFADDASQTNLTVTVTSQYSDRTYKAYQIFEGDIESNDASASSRKLSNIKWATGVNNTAIVTALNGTGEGQLNLGITGTGTSGAVTAQDVADKLSTITDTDTLIKIAKIFNTNKGTAAGTSGTGTVVSPATDPATYTYTINNLNAGYYIIVDETNVSNKDESVSAILLNLVGNTTVTEKAVKPSVDKEVQDEAADKDSHSTDTTNGYGETADQAINETFQFKLEATLPADADYNAYPTYQVKFVDVPSAGITFEEIDSVIVKGKTSENQDASVTVSAYKADGTDAEKVGYVLTNSLSDNKGDGSKTLEINIADLKATAPTVDLTKGATVTVIYKAHLNESAYVTPVGGKTTTNKNKVHLEYSNNPNATGSGKTEDKETYVFTFEVDNTKWAGPGTKVETPANVTITGTNPAETLASTSKTSWADDTSHKFYQKNGDDWYVMDPLAGAEFKLYAKSGTTETEVKLIYDNSKNMEAYRPIKSGETATVMSSATSTGLFNIKGLDAGTYVLRETKTPDGYNTAADINITISAVHEIDNNTAKVTLNNTNDDNEIVDNSGTTLPSTGGIGTTIFYVIGAILVIGAGVILVTRRRMNVQ